MSIAALKKAAGSSKVLIFAVFAAAITVARWQGWADQEWWQHTLENAYYALMGGYSIVEVAREVYKKQDPEQMKTMLLDLLKDPRAAMGAANDDAEADDAA